MPPRCCSVISLASVAHLLSNAEADLYKAKFEEWNTPNRLYCPIPSCSTFISTRLYEEKPEPIVTNIAGDHSGVELSETFAAFEEPVKLEPKFRSQVACPTCHISVCTQCREQAHVGECSGNDIQPDLEHLLQRWNIKRCPKCRTGIRKVYGCSHVECRCGAHFCYGCLQSIILCGGCENEDEDASEISDEDDLDGMANFTDGDGLDFGEEPEDPRDDGWTCEHDWKPVIKSSTSVESRISECYRCFRPVDSQEPLKKSPHEGDEVGKRSYMSYGDEAWKCFCGKTTCRNCPLAAPRWRVADVERKWTCDCGITCAFCIRLDAHAKFEEEGKAGWECECGTIICGACRDLT
ncbi:RING/U-box [Glarea lozoyensis ATCC 20868]|uniref:RBR-type E3 ubiquitin transferase n=1 Tax=Glarea lozoyensis (strain ATCC 20868 / MF5171) TaxID=1116229 RepID=S3DR69_GLAL2|nr:RING/U-box [Glarea lozoyensis ATCC 20868]EPE34516.1 RING/U-box [Glarea lozoyensis ATCC 20868]